MADTEPLLLSVFYDLRARGVPLGLPEYLLAVETLRGGVGLESSERLRRVCRLLWAKSVEDQQLFDLVFNLRMGAWLRPQGETARESAPPAPAVTPPTPLGDRAPTPPPHEETPSPAETGPESEHEGALGQFSLNPGVAQAQTFDPSWRPWFRYQLTTQPPVSQREMSRIWRQLRRVGREGPPEVLDVQGTIDSISRTGVFLRPAMQPRRRNQVRLLLLVDCFGSMSAFSLVVRAVVQSILRGGLLGQTSIYYFHDAPEGALYESPGLLRARSLEDVFAARAKGSSVLFLSDAGAARGRYDGARARNTRRCVELLRNYTYLYAWLNPVPAARWRDTTAEEVARSVPMFPLTREGLIDAVNILRGQPFPPGVA